MKKPLVFIGIVLFSLPLQAQVADYFANNPTWRQHWMFNYSCADDHNYVYYLGGDSLINGHTYKIIRDRHYVSHAWINPSPPPNECHGSEFTDQIKTLLRQEGKKIFKFESPGETLLYDFDLAVGDSLPVTDNLSSPDIMVVSIDSIVVGSSHRKIFNLNVGGLGPGKLIEGIGFNTGLLEPYLDWEFPAELLCFRANDITYYPELGSECDLAVGVPEVNVSAGPDIYPNPASDYFLVNFGPDAQDMHLQVFDMEGNRVHVDYEVYQGNVFANTAKLRKGIYGVQCSQAGKKPIYLKLIIQ